MRILTTDPEELAKLRVLRGIKWLDENAPPDWRRRLIDVHNGYLSARFRLYYDKENLVALAFELDELLANDMGYVTYAQVAKRYGWRFPDRRPVALGFEVSATGPDIYKERGCLERTWWQLVTTSHAHQHILHQHPVRWCYNVVPSGGEVRLGRKLFRLFRLFGERKAT